MFTPQRYEKIRVNALISYVKRIYNAYFGIFVLLCTTNILPDEVLAVVLWRKT